MDNNGSKLSDKSELPTELKLENTVDTSGMWFVAAVLFAVLAAGIVIYRAANDGIRTAAILCPRRLQVRDRLSHRPQDVCSWTQSGRRHSPIVAHSLTPAGHDQ
jgi:hypothetical protein